MEGIGYTPITQEQIADFGPCSLIYTQDRPLSEDGFRFFVDRAREKAEAEELRIAEETTMYEESARRWQEAEDRLAEEDEGRDLTAEEVAEGISVCDYHEVIEGMTLRMIRIAEMEEEAAGTTTRPIQILREEAFSIIEDLGNEVVTPEEAFDRAADMLVTVEDCDCTNEYIAAVCNNPDLPLGHFAQD